MVLDFSKKIIKNIKNLYAYIYWFDLYSFTNLYYGL